MPHFHLPLQSGDDEVLGLMRRRYRRSLYEQRVRDILSLMPDACIGGDVIVGFPGETEGHFLNTVAFLENLPLAYLHVFTYSERPGTVAAEQLATVGNQVPLHERSRRNKILTVLSEKKRTQFYKSFLGRERPVLWERGNVRDTMTGFTDNYIRVEKAYNSEDASSVQQVVLASLAESGNVSVRSDTELPVLN